MLEEGFFAEVSQLGTLYGWDSSAFDVVGYRAFKDVVLGTKKPQQGAADFVKADMALWKKQLTWLKRNVEIVWLKDPEEAHLLVRKFLKQG